MHTLLFCSNSTMLKWSNNVSPLCEINPLEQGTSMATVREVLEKIKHTRLVIEAALQELIATRRDEAVAPPEEQERIMNQIEAMQDDADLMEKICGLVEKEQPNALTDGALDLDRVLVGTIRKIQLLIQKHKVERGRMTPGARGRVTPR